jgi:hypothetical protein
MYLNFKKDLRIENSFKISDFKFEILEVPLLGNRKI